MYGIIAQQLGVGESFSIQQLFIAGLLPALLMIVLLSVWSLWYNRNNDIEMQPFSSTELKAALWEAKWELPLPVLVIGGIYGGIFAVSETAAVIALYVLIIEVFVYREISLKQLPSIVSKSMAMVGGIILILGVSLALTNVFIDAEIPTRAFELINAQGFEFLDEVALGYKKPFAQTPEWSVLMKIGLPSGQSPQSALEALFEAAGDLVLDGVIAQSGKQAQELWDIRELIPEGNRRIGSVSSHDISVPISSVPDFIVQAPDLIAKIGDFRINCFGHLGDGNLHYNVFPQKGHARAEHADQRDAVKTAVHGLAHSFGGSVSAEHGIGRLKVSDLETYGDPAKLAMMRSIKDALDPRGILNPGAVLRA